MDEGVTGLLIMLKVGKGREVRGEIRLDEGDEMSMEVAHNDCTTYIYVCES